MKPTSDLKFRKQIVELLDESVPIGGWLPTQAIMERQHKFIALIIMDKLETRGYHR
jgi:hypothetical protein